MSLLSGLRTILLAESTMQSLVADAGSGYEKRGIYVNGTPPLSATDFPHILITQIGGESNSDLSGLDLTSSGELLMADVDLDCKAVTYAQAYALALATAKHIESFTGTAGSVTIAACLVEDGLFSTDYEPPVSGQDYPIHVVTVNANIQYRPA